MSNKATELTIDLDARPATLGMNINRFRVKNGEENVAYFSLRLAGIRLTEEEVDKLMPTFSRAFFETRGNDKLPNFPQLSGFNFRDWFEGAHVVIVPGVNGQGRKLELKDAKIKKLVFEPTAGGATLLSLTVIAPKPTTKSDVETLDRLDDRFGAEVHVSIAGAEIVRPDEEQQELPINTFGDGERPQAH